MLVFIDNADSMPVYLQIAEQIRGQILKGDLKQGDELPSVRELAASLGINMHTVRHAYVVLRDQGLLNFRLGQQARVARLNTVNADQPAFDFITRKLKYLIAEALLMGITAEDFRAMTDRELINIINTGKKS